MFLHKTTWPHELVNTSVGQPATYVNLSIVMFVSGFPAMMEKENEAIQLLMARHLQELMADAELYGWDPVRSYHAVWLQQLENNRV